jgi:hypothetical protein
MAMRTATGLAVWIALLIAQPVAAAPIPPADKFIAFVRAENCQLGPSWPRIDAASKSLVRDKSTSWVAVNVSADPEKNLNAMGVAAPFLAAVEAKAPAAALPGLIARVRKTLGTSCKIDIYTIGERTVQPFARTWELGQTTPTSKVFWTAVRKDGLSLAQFNDEWAGPHAAFAMANRARDAKLAPPPRGARYIQNVVLGKDDAGSPDVDGIVEDVRGQRLGPQLVEATRQALDDPQDESTRHSKTFLDMSKVRQWIATEIILKD